MELHSLIGKVIKDILVIAQPFEEFSEYDLWKADCYVVLENDLIVGIPSHLDDIGAWIREFDPSAKSYFTRKWWQRKVNERNDLRGRKITDIIDFPEGDERAFFELDNGKVITEVSVASPGMSVGLYVYNSIHDVEKKFGSGYVRLSNVLLQ
jgi:hypothetical protein